jgi:hypothetical protein
MRVPDAPRHDLPLEWSPSPHCSEHDVDHRGWDQEADQSPPPSFAEEHDLANYEQDKANGLAASETQGRLTLDRVPDESERQPDHDEHGVHVRSPQLVSTDQDPVLVELP